MSIKDLFNKTGTPKIQPSVTSDEMVANVESSEYVAAKKDEFEQFIPPIDFVSASNFAKFGSAELYYEKAFERIYNYYPYDGTLAEKTEFHNSSSYLDKHVFDSLYPRTNGYMNFNGNSQYITVFGGPHTASAGMIGKTLDSTFDSSNVYSESEKRTSAFEFRGDDGITAEFWLKVPNISSNKYIMHVTGALAGEIRLVLNTSDELVMNMGSGSSLAIPAVTVLDGAISSAFNTWNHYAVTVLSSSAGLTYKGFKNGQLKKTTASVRHLPTILPVTNGISMTIAADATGGNLLTGSIDEFRFWKKAKTTEEVYNSWFTAIGGGTNKHDSNIALGLYFKFNEGITTNTSLDGIALDYSGRINNGTIVGYDTTMRSTNSAITEKLGEPEFLDPIIYSTHPDVVAKKAEYKTSGSLADLENSSTMFGYFPGWMQEEDEQSGNQLKYLAQVMGSYFDTLWHQINFTNRIHDNHYISGSNKPLPFAKKLLYDRGFVMPDMFADATITENLLNKDDNEVYEKQINEVRNTIYHNLYNNLETIYKSKGTEKSFRNFFRSLGIGQDVVKLRMYADDSTFVLRNNYEHKSYERKFLNFNREGHFDASVYQTSSTNNVNTFIPGDTNFSGSFTLETEIILPRKSKSNEIGYFPYPALTASVLGFHSSGSNPVGYTHLAAASDKDLSIYVIKENLDSSLTPDDSQRVKFMVTGAFGELTSPIYSYQYENNKWSIAAKVRHANYPYGNVTGNVPNNYLVEFYGVEADSNTKRNSFYLTSSIDVSYFTSNKIFYAGAHRTNFSGSSIHDTDIKLGQARYWHSYLSNDAIDQHAYDSETFGANEPFENDLVDTYSIEIPREKTLSFYWAFNNLTGSDSSGEIIISDLSSGSAASNYGSLSNTIERYVEGKAIGFNASATNALDKMFIQTARKRLPDDLMSSDLTTIKSDETENFYVDEDVSDNFYSFEKSMHGTISDEMMNMFSTALDLNNLVGQPNQKYHHRYGMADFLRDRFYEDVENSPDIEKFTSFYKWIDDSISIALQQLVPASARFSEKITNIIESHVLERNKYVHQVPVLTTFQSTEGSIKGITEMKYDWEHGHAPFFPEEEQTNVLWQRERKSKEGLRETLRTSRNNNSVQSSGLIRKEIGGATRISDTYAIRRFSKLYDLSMVSQASIHGGVNFGRQKNLQLFHEATAPGGALGPTSGAPQNVITVGVGAGDGLVRGTRDEDNPPRKKKFSSEASVGKLEGADYGDSVKGNVVLPMNLMSGTVHTGYNHEVKTSFASDVVLSNLHHDTVGNYNETSMQGPFTDAHVGGLQYRHIDVNKHDLSKTVSVSYQTGGVFPSGSIGFTNSVLSDKLALGTGSFVTVRDGDGTIVTANYSNVYDLYDNQWTDMDELVFILDNKLNVTANKISNSFLALTQSVTGNFYNYQIQSASHGYITASGFDGGTPITFSTLTRNLDGPSNRPEGWGLVFKDHPSTGDYSGSLGFVGADYGSTYPSPVKLKATRYREETAKRPVNIRNIKTSTTSQKAGNYSNAIQLFSVAPEHQKTWAIEANEDPNINILPPFIATPLPSTTHYQTLMGIAPFEKGNIFGGGMTGNRQPDTGNLVVTAEVFPRFATGSFGVLGKDYQVDGSSVQVNEARQYFINSGGAHTISTGSSDAIFWANITSSLASEGRFNATFTSTPAVYSRSIRVTLKNDSFLSASVTGNRIATGSFALSAWLSLAPGGNSRYIYREATSGNIANGTGQLDNIGRVLYIDAHNKIHFNTAYSASTGGFKYDQYYKDLDDVPNWPGHEKPFHLVVSHTGVNNVFDATSFWIDGVLIQDVTASRGTGTGVLTQNPPDEIILLNSKVGGTDTLWGTSGASFIDDIVLLNTTASQAAATALYNCGTQVSIPSLYGIMTSASITQYWDLQGSSISTGDLITGAGSAPLDLHVRNTSTAMRMVTDGTEGAAPISLPTATIHLTGSGYGAENNGIISTTSMGTCPAGFFGFLGPSGGVNAVAEDIRFSNDNVIQVPSTASQYISQRNINTRFSAPGGPEIQSTGYLDAYSQTYSVYNALPYRNLSVLGSGSGESGTIRVNDDLGKRRGLKTLRALHQGKFGIDSTYGVVTATSYPSSGSFNKQHRNTSKAYQYSSGVLIITGSNHDNMHINSSIPRSEFQYSWIRSAISGSNWENDQRILGYAPKSGIVSSSAGYVEAIVFPTASTIRSL